MVESLADVEVLGVEFNHDVALQRSSAAASFLIERNLSDLGHLSNGQGAELIQAVLAIVRTKTLRHLVLLHFSEQCNQPAPGDPGRPRRDRSPRDVISRFMPRGRVRPFPTSGSGPGAALPCPLARSPLEPRALRRARNDRSTGRIPGLPSVPWSTN